MKVEPETVYTGITISCDSYYSSKGRVDPEFNDKNEKPLEHLIHKLPDLKSVEIESFQLVHLSKIARSQITTTSLVFILA